MYTTLRPENVRFCELSSLSPTSIRRQLGLLASNCRRQPPSRGWRQFVGQMRAVSGLKLGDSSIHVGRQFAKKDVRI
jgi:hypothetical protein